MRKAFLLLATVAAVLAGALFWKRSATGSSPTEAGAPLDSLDGVVVRHNDGFGQVHGRNVVDGYNVGLRYQCVEFVKRYYLERFGHRMPNSYGHARDFFDRTIADGAMNSDRGLLQFTNGSAVPPERGDLIVLDGWKGNRYGHVAIVSAVEDGEVEVIQQNTRSTRAHYDLDLVAGKWRIDHDRILGWLRIP